MQLLGTTEAAQRIGCDPRTVQRWARALNLGQRIGGRLVLRPADVDAIGRRVQAGPGNPDFRAAKKT